jgi:TonB family protein
VLDVTDDDRLEPVLGPTVARDAENGREPTLFFVTPEEGHSGAGAETASPESKNTDRTKLEIGGVHGFQAWPSRPSRNDHPRGENERWWVRLRGPVGSLILHLLPLLLLIDWPMSPSAQVEPIPVQLVFEPPPKATPPPLSQPKKPTPPPPRGRLASEDLGEPEAKEVDKPKGDPPAADKPAKTETPPAETKPPEKPQQTAALAPPPLPPAKPDAPKPDPVPKPAPKPTPAAHRVPKPVEDPANMAPRRGRFPGPAATRDEYLAYMHSLIRQHYNMLSSAMLGERRGMTVIEFVVLDDGKIALVKIRRSSGYPDIDNRVAEMISAVGHFPPLPQWFQGLAMPFEFGFPFPEALRE